MGDGFIYLDYNATTPTDPRVAEAMRPFLTGCFGNPSSDHRAGREARQAVDQARTRVASSIGARADEIIFTSGGTESNNLAFHGLVAARGGGHVITSAIEHPAVLEVVLAMEGARGIEMTIVGVDSRGRVDPAVVEQALRPDTILVSLMLANNEVGTLQPVAEVARLCRQRGVTVHTDAAQAVGKVPVDVEKLDVDLLSIAGHKLYAPKGVGALYIRRGVTVLPFTQGAGHERGLRPGTENVLEIVGLGRACELVERELDEEIPRLRLMRGRLRDLLAERIPDLVEHGHPQHRLPNTLSVAFPGVEAAEVLARLENNVAASAGAACHEGGAVLSHVLWAMGVDPKVARSTLRLSVGRFTSDEDLEIGARLIADAAGAARKE
ncbi:MAG: cysteine desulfurase [Acidobacteria bacterium]|nr:cysteine desulfurase [Acidobacteriota bacterium]